MKIIDTHAHIFPPKIEPTATTAIQNFYDRSFMHHAGSVEDLLRSGARAGLTNYVVFSTATTPHQVTRINDYIYEQTLLHPEFVGVGTLHKDFEDYADEIEKLYARGIYGIKFHPDFQKFNIDDEKLMPVFRLLEQKDMFVITHSGDHRYTFSHPERVARIARLFPKMRIVAAHFGGWMQWELARQCLVLPNVYVDTSSTYNFGGAEPVIKGLDAFDKKHIFFGCDFPMWDHSEELEHIRKLVRDDGVYQDILFNNFADFYSHYDKNKLQK